MKKWLKILAILAVIGLIAAFLVYKYVYNKPHTDYAAAKPDYILPAQDLYNAFKNHPEASAKLYNGKVIQIQGELARTESTDSLVVLVFSFNQGMFGDEGIRGTMIRKLNEEGKKLVPAGNVTIKGYCTGFNDTDVILEQCSVIY